MHDIFKKSFFEFVFSVVASRWQEIVLLVGLHGGLTFVLIELVGLAEPGGEMNDSVMFLAMAGSVAFAVILYMLVYGFLRSVALVGCEPLMPMVLLKLGRRLFFRMFRFEIILALLTVLVFIVFASVAGSVVQIEKENTLGQIRIGVFCMFFSLICLIKLRLVVMGVILVRDCRIREAFRCLRQYRLADGGAMLVVFGVSVAVRSVALYLLQAATVLRKDTLVYSILNGGVIGVTVVLWGLCSIWFASRSATEEAIVESRE